MQISNELAQYTNIKYIYIVPKPYILRYSNNFWDNCNNFTPPLHCYHNYYYSTYIPIRILTYVFQYKQNTSCA